MVDSNQLTDKDIAIVIASQPLQLKNAVPTSSLFDHFRVVTSFFETPGSNATVDGVRGYSINGKFCGLRFRRKARWDLEPLGMASAYQIEFVLDKNEKFDGIYRTGTAVAVRSTVFHLRTLTNSH
jgi:hypothetical protein